MDTEPRTEDLENALLGTARVSAPEDVGGLDAWLRSIDARPGQTPATPATDAWVVYKGWALTVGVEPLAPFVFAGRMLGIFAKAPNRYWRRADGSRVRVGLYLMTAAAAKRLIATARAHPPTAEERALFTYPKLLEAKHPARKVAP